MTFSEDSKFESQIKTLIERKFGDLLTWEKPLIRQTVGPFDTTNIDQLRSGATAWWGKPNVCCEGLALQLSTFCMTTIVRATMSDATNGLPVFEER